MNTDRVGRVTIVLGNGIATVNEVDHGGIVLSVASDPNIDLASALSDDRQQIEERDLNDPAATASQSDYSTKKQLGLTG